MNLDGIELIEDSVKERILITTRSRRLGEVLFKDVALATVSLFNNCICFKQSTKRCSNCNQAYCSRSCQVQDHPVHQKVCGHGDEFEMLYRVMLLPKESRDSIRSLVSHFDKVESREYDEIRDICTKYLDLIGSEESLEYLMETISIFRRNNFTLYDEKVEVYAQGAFPIASLMNHSCYPNCVVQFNGNEMSVIALRELQKDEEILISYVDSMTEFDERNGGLAEQYFFDCICDYCMLSLPISEGTVDETDFAPVPKIIDFYRLNCDDPEYFSKRLEIIQETPSELCNVPRYTILRRKMNNAINVQDWPTAAMFSETAFSIMLCYYPPHHPMIAINAYLVAKLKWNAFLEPRDYIEISINALKVLGSKSLLAEVSDLQKLSS